MSNEKTQAEQTPCAFCETPSICNKQGRCFKPQPLRDYWRCFHCDFATTSREEAEVHFGERDDAEEFKPICKWWTMLAEDERVGTLRGLLQQLNYERMENYKLEKQLQAAQPSAPVEVEGVAREIAEFVRIQAQNDGPYRLTCPQAEERLRTIIHKHLGKPSPASGGVWISVASGELPQIGEWVNVVHAGVVQRMAARLLPDENAPVWAWADETADCALLHEMSHWQPLPTPPQPSTPKAAEPATQTPKFVMVADGEGAALKIITDEDPHDVAHRFMCFCGKPWKECETEDIRRDLAWIDDPEQWTLYEGGNPFAVYWHCETGRIALYKLAAPSAGKDGE